MMRSHSDTEHRESMAFRPRNPFVISRPRMTEEELQDVERHFAEVLAAMRAGEATATFMVTTTADDAASTYFAGADGEQVPAGLTVMAALAEFLAKQGVMLSALDMAELGRLIRSGE
jgi:hypothetical protein